MKELERLVRYHDGELNEAERQELAEDLRNDPSLNEKLHLIDDVDKLIGDKPLSTFEDSLKEVESMYFNTNIPGKAFSFPKYARVAAIIVLLFSSVAYFYFSEGKGSDNDKLFASYYEKMPADFNTRSATSDDEFMMAIKLYNENKYSQAIIEFDKILKKDPTNVAAKLFLGICYTETQNFDTAMALFKNILLQNDTIFDEHANWYLSLCYIKVNKPQLAKPILDKLISSHSFYMNKAFELKKKLI